MIYVSKKQLDQVEYLIQQSQQGNHVLFDENTLHRVFGKDQNAPFCPLLTEEEAYSVEHHIEKLLELSSLGEKRAYLDHLDEETLDRVVRTYFNIVENNLYEENEVKH